MGVFAKYGFHGLAEKVRLGKFLVERLNAPEGWEKLSNAERARMAFEELGPTFIKLGQLLATRTDLIPESFAAEFAKLHDRVSPLSFAEVKEVLSREYGPDWEKKFESIDEAVLGSASIAQVHRARLAGGSDVVVKVQRPGVVEKIDEDLGVLYMLADLLQKYVPEVRPFNPVAIVDEFFKTLELETNFIVEANNIRRFQQNFRDDPNVVIPKVYLDMSTEKVLVLEALEGIPLSHTESLRQEGINPNEIIRLGLRAYLKMVFMDGLFHGDLHAGNFFVMPGNRIGLIDFGVVGRLNPKTQSSIANMLIALSKEDYERLALEYVDLCPFTDKVNVDLFAKELRELIAPFYGLTLKNVNAGRLLMGSARIASKHHLRVPPELMLFFKSIVSIEGLGRKIHRDFDFLSYSLEFASELVKHQFDSGRLLNDVTEMARESRNFLNALPRQLNFFIRKLNSPEHAFRMEISHLEELKKTVEVSFNLLFLGVVIASLILSASIILAGESGPAATAGLPPLSFVFFLLAGSLGVLAVINYFRKS
ncbi:MAG: AarF/ABC1/UbiB kinase family protein [Bdellovibrionaceae bacterium]|nr:AarF/ABC1/UbiB kinase family protein [Pseudobdellovibrionaceae bacterium]